MTSFKLDENLSHSVAQVFREAGHDASTVHAQGLGGEKDDAIARRCRNESRVIVTCDSDFADPTRGLPAESPGAVVLRLPDQRLEFLRAAATRVVAMLEHEPIAGKLWIVERYRIRIRDVRQ